MGGKSRQQHECSDAIPCDGKGKIRVSPFRRGARPPARVPSTLHRDARYWDPAITDPLATGREVILFESTGLGRSSGKVPETVAGMAAHALAFLDGLGLKTFVLGFSLGGMVAQQMALDRPSIFRRMILVGTAPRGGELIMHLDKPGLAKPLADPNLKGYAVLQKIFFAPTDSSQAAGAAFIERLTKRNGDRGKVLENGAPRFFRRFGEGFDVEDLKFRTEELAQFIDTASERYELSKKRLIAVGYSNGANIAASLILLHPHYLAAALLFQPIVPFAPDLIRDLSHLSVFIGAGRLDLIVPSGQAEELGAIFESGGADVTISWHHGGHELGEDDVRAAKAWLSKEKVRKKVAA